MAFQQADLDKIDKAIASGLQEVVFADGRKVRYQTTDDMLKARDLVSRALAPLISAAERSRHRLVIGRTRGYR